MIEIRAVGGYNEVGRNMTAIKVDDEVVILDMGIHIENYINYTEDEDFVFVDVKEMIKVDAVPDITTIDDWKDKVKVIVPTHAHLDHVGAIPFLANNFKAPLLCSPYTAEVIKTILKEDKIKLNNRINVLNTNSIYQISENLKIEFINMTHSVPDTVMVAVHTKYGVIVYANDFKFDMNPTLGEKPNMKRLEELGKKGILALIVESTYSRFDRKTESESVAREKLKDVMLGTDTRGKAVIVTTFSSHIARMKSIVEFGRKMNRKIVFMGRSLSKYSEAAENIDLVNFSKQVEMAKYGNQIKRMLKKITKEGKEKYLMVVTGHQGEPKATLSKMSAGIFKFWFEPGDIVIFSSSVIPTETNRKNREILEGKLSEYDVEIFRDIHVSGHAAGRDIKELINIVKPNHIIPAHGSKNMTNSLADIAKGLKYKKENIHILNNGQKINIMKIC
ncbi:RNase J family beta-CASP ribonuclease [Candidatus Woesearchaeota archaeon]|nr:RNase J family beta-CASP ribonuclease [Candidatus Woesearchaeota archaeon]